MVNVSQVAGADAPVGGPEQTIAVTDASLLLIELGKLMHRSEATNRAIDKLADRLESTLSGLENTVKGACAVGYLLVGAIALLAGGVWWLGAALWPVRQKLIAAILG